MTPFPKRKSPRLQGYDYSQDGSYFVTICTHLRENRFGQVIDAEMVLNTLGCIAEACWEAIPSHFANVELDAYVVMPNHVHGIVIINGYLEKMGRDSKQTDTVDEGTDTIYRVRTD